MGVTFPAVLFFIQYMAGMVFCDFYETNHTNVTMESSGGGFTILDNSTCELATVDNFGDQVFYSSCVLEEYNDGGGCFLVYDLPLTGGALTAYRVSSMTIESSVFHNNVSTTII